MSGFDKDEFYIKVMSLYPLAKENNYMLKLDEEQVRELKEIYINLYIPIENLGHYDDEKLMKKLMTAIVSVCPLDKDAMNNRGELIHLVNSVNYDGRNLYLRFAKISAVKLRRLEIGKSQKQGADLMGYNVSAVRNCEESYCDMSRQPDTLVTKLAKALECDIETLMN